MKVAMDAAVAELIAAVPTLTQESAAAALEVAVPISVRGAARYLEELVAHLADHPDALVSGESHCPPVLVRLTHLLHDGGHPVIRLVCAWCGRVTTELRWLRPEGRVCGTCDSRSRLSTCERCHRDGVRIAARKADGRICYRCYHNDPETLEQCAGCGRMGRPVQRLDGGSSLCHRCWKRPEHECISCGETRPAAVVDDNGACCYNCYNRHGRPDRPCGRCGRIRPIRRAATGDQPDLCDSCYRGPDRKCSRCGRIRPCTRIGSCAPICHSCYARDERPRVTCQRCRRSRSAQAYWPIGPVCMSCYTAILRAPDECGSCRAVQPLIGRSDDGARICGPCAGYDIDYTCGNCGRTGNPYAHDGCAYCVLITRARTLLTGPDGEISPELQPLFEALIRSESPFKQIQWLKDSPVASLLAQLAASNEPMSHDLLDEFPLSRNVHYLRQMLVQTGVLERRNEDLDRLPAWLDHQLAGRPARHENLIRPYLHWHLLRRARRRAAARRYPATATHHIRRRIFVALELLEWIDNQELSLKTLRQEHIDRWLDDSTTQRRNASRYFLKWTHQRGLTGNLVVPDVPWQHPAEFLDEDNRWQLLRRCLTDDAIPTDVRAAGALTLLFGLRGERIRNLTADQIIDKAQDTYLALGDHPLLLPPRLARLLQALADEPPPRLTIPHGLSGPRWLFPGRVPGQPIANSALSGRLNRYGITIRTARNGALAALAEDLPAAVLADLLDIHLHTAIRWVKHARRDWADYLAARAAEQAERAGQAGE